LKNAQVELIKELGFEEIDLSDLYLKPLSLELYGQSSDKPARRLIRSGHRTRYRQR